MYDLPCSVYLLSLASTLRTRKAHVYFLSRAHAFLPSLFGLFAFSPPSALRTRKVHVYFLSPIHAFLPSLLGLLAFSHKHFKNKEGSCIFPFSCTRLSTFPVWSICFLSQFGLFAFPHKRLKNEGGSCSISFYLPCSVHLLSLQQAL